MQIDAIYHRNCVLKPKVIQKVVKHKINGYGDTSFSNQGKDAELIASDALEKPILDNSEESGSKTKYIDKLKRKNEFLVK